MSERDYYRTTPGWRITINLSAVWRWVREWRERRRAKKEEER